MPLCFGWAYPPLFKTYFQPFAASSNGRIDVTGILDIKHYRSANIEIVQQPGTIPNLTVIVMMGKISGVTLAQDLDRFPLPTGPAMKAEIRTYSVVGPEISVIAEGAPPNSTVNIQAWLFLH